jgi:hypothetical protein
VAAGDEDGDVVRIRTEIMLADLGEPLGLLELGLECSAGDRGDVDACCQQVVQGKQHLDRMVAGREQFAVLT